MTMHPSTATTRTWRLPRRIVFMQDLRCVRAVRSTSASTRRADRSSCARGRRHYLVGHFTEYVPPGVFPSAWGFAPGRYTYRVRVLDGQIRPLDEKLGQLGAITVE